MISRWHADGLEAALARAGLATFDAIWDLDEGYVTAKGAQEDYGCVIGKNGRIDRAASDARRGARELVPEPAE